MKREIPLFLTLVAGLFMVLGFFIPQHDVQFWQNQFQTFGIILLAASVLLGIMNLFRINLIAVSRKAPDTPYKVVLLVCLAGMFLLGMNRPFTWDYVATGPGTLFNDVFNAAYVPLQATLFSLLAFFIASAAFRAFRIRTVEAGLLAVAGILVMIGRVPLGDAIWPGPHGISDIQEWIMNVPTVAARRAIFIGAALGAISLGLRVILGLERAHLGGE